MAVQKFAEVADITAITGVTVAEDERTRAAIVIETMTGLIESVDRPDISDRDRYYLKLATAFQAAWMHDHPDLYSREDVTSASQDGESVTFRNVDAHTLAPLARKSIRRLSWRGIRAIAPGNGVPVGSSTRPNVNSEEYDDWLFDRFGKPV